jgi:hypothetical protein
MSRECAHEVRRVMRERASRVSLQPELEERCRAELAEHCSHDTQVYITSYIHFCIIDYRQMRKSIVWQRKWTNSTRNRSVSQHYHNC